MDAGYKTVSWVLPENHYATLPQFSFQNTIMHGLPVVTSQNLFNSITNQVFTWALRIGWLYLVRLLLFKIQKAFYMRQFTSCPFKFSLGFLHFPFELAYFLLQISLPISHCSDQLAF